MPIYVCRHRRWHLDTHDVHWLKCVATNQSCTIWYPAEVNTFYEGTALPDSTTITTAGACMKSCFLAATCTVAMFGPSAAGQITCWTRSSIVGAPVTMAGVTAYRLKLRNTNFCDFTVLVWCLLCVSLCMYVHHVCICIFVHVCVYVFMHTCTTYMRKDNIASAQEEEHKCWAK
jgi:hypothetical protein